VLIKGRVIEELCPFTGLIILLIVLFVFQLASGNNTDFAPQIRAYLTESFDIDFFATAMTMGGVLVAIYAIYKQQQKQKLK